MRTVELALTFYNECRNNSNNLPTSNYMKDQ